MKRKTNMTYHSRYERYDRLTYILEKIGDFGETVAVAEQYDEVCERWAVLHLTSTGILIVKALDGKVITAYIPRTGKAISVYKTCFGDKRMPNALYKRICWNQMYVNDQPSS